MKDLGFRIRGDFCAWLVGRGQDHIDHIYINAGIYSFGHMKEQRLVWEINWSQMRSQHFNHLLSKKYLFFVQPEPGSTHIQCRQKRRRHGELRWWILGCLAKRWLRDYTPLKLTAFSPLKIGRAPKGNGRIPSMLVSWRVSVWCWKPNKICENAPENKANNAPKHCLSQQTAKIYIVNSQLLAQPCSIQGGKNVEVSEEKREKSWYQKPNATMLDLPTSQLWNYHATMQLELVGMHHQCHDANHLTGLACIKLGAGSNPGLGINKSSGNLWRHVSKTI